MAEAGPAASRRITASMRSLPYMSSAGFRASWMPSVKSTSTCPGVSHGRRISS